MGVCVCVFTHQNVSCKVTTMPIEGIQKTDALILCLALFLLSSLLVKYTMIGDTNMYKRSLPSCSGGIINILPWTAAL